MGRFAGLARAENGGRGCFKSNEGTSELNYTTLDAMNSVTAFICFCVTMAANLSWAQPIVIDWQEVGGVNMFERQAVTFTPIQVDSFDFFQSDGLFFNLGDTSNSSIKAMIYIYIGEIWELFAENDKIQGPYHSFFFLHDFVFLPIDFSKGMISGINITNSGAGITQYFGMTENGAGTRFVFSTTPIPVPEPTTYFVFAIGLLFLLTPQIYRNKYER